MNCLFVIFIYSILKFSWGLENGLALTPPMGWLTWQRYRCTVDCDTRPDECISEKLIMDVADSLVSDGYLAAGYEYVGIDDCWSELKRDENEKLVPDKRRFPRGMKFLGDYLHSKGLKFGIYGDIGTYTCAGYPGSLNHMEIDTQTFAEWGADYIKLDGCYIETNKMDEAYPIYGKFLNKTDRPILYSCSWPAYQEYPNYTAIMKHCNLWRNYGDIDDSFQSVLAIMRYFGNMSTYLQKFAGPGHWNDPDMLVVGNFGLSYEQAKVQMAIWSILAAPMLISADLKNMDPKMKDLLLNKKVLDINQDRLGKAGIRIFEDYYTSVWLREVTPVKNKIPSLAIAFVNYRTDGTPTTYQYTFQELKLNSKYNYTIEDLLPSKTQSWKLSYNKKTKKYTIRTTINPTGVMFLKFTINYNKLNTGSRPFSPSFL